MPRSHSSTDSSRSTAVVGTILVLGVLHLARDVLIPIATALLFTFVLAPMTRRLQRLGLGRMPSASLVVLAVVLCAGGLAWVIGHQIFDLASNLPAYRQNIRAKVESLRPSGSSALSNLGEGLREIKELAGPTPTPHVPATAPKDVPRPTPLRVEVIEPPPGATDVLRSMVGPLLGPLMDLGIMLVFLLFMLVQCEDLRDRLIRLMGQGHISVTTAALDDAATRVSSYLSALAAVNLVFGVCVAAGLYLIGVPNALLWGFLAGLLRFIPFLGAWVGLLMPLAVSIATSRTWTTPLCTAALFATLEIFTNNFVEPVLYGHGTGISTLAVVVSAVFWAWLWGPAGLLLATPLTVCLVVVSRYVPQLEFIGVLLGDERALSPETNFYQRLLAMDQVEAAEIADAYLEEHPLIELYDNLIIPALSLAESDRHHGDLAPDREQFIVQSMRDLVDDLADRRAEPGTLRTGRVVCLPARDEADATAARLLAQLLEGSGAIAEVVSADLLSVDMLELIAREPPNVIVISAIPPFAVMYANYMFKRVRRRFPDIPVVVGLWHPAGASSAAHRRLAGVCGDRLKLTLGAALEQVLALLPEDKIERQSK